MINLLLIYRQKARSTYSGI